MKRKTLSARWNKRQKDILYWFPHKCDGGMLNHYLTGKRYNPCPLHGAPKWENSLIEELEARGYDITTLKFSIQLKEEVDNLEKEDKVKI